MINLKGNISSFKVRFCERVMSNSYAICCRFCNLLNHLSLKKELNSYWIDELMSKMDISKVDCCPQTIKQFHSYSFKYFSIVGLYTTISFTLSTYSSRNKMIVLQGKLPGCTRGATASCCPPFFF